MNVEADVLSQILWHKTKSEYQDLDYLTVKAIIGECITEIPLIKAYVRKAFISSQGNAISENKIDQNSLITNKEWKE